MKPEGNLQIYRVAFETASTELTEIAAEAERLQIRKEQIERLITVLAPLVDEEIEVPGQVSAQGPEHQEEVKEPAAEGSLQHEPFTADPFQRRIDHVLGIGAGIRDVRKYSRQF
ncbi:MAG TPA: hypothetical protein VGI45_28775 [Terracidiphilus sp.]